MIPPKNTTTALCFDGETNQTLREHRNTTNNNNRSCQEVTPVGAAADMAEPSAMDEQQPKSISILTRDASPLPAVSDCDIPICVDIAIALSLLRGLPAELVRLVMDCTCNPQYIYHGSAALALQGIDGIFPGDLDIRCSPDAARQLVALIQQEVNTLNEQNRDQKCSVVASPVIPGIEPLSIPEQINLTIHQREHNLKVQLNLIGDNDNTAIPEQPTGNPAPDNLRNIHAESLHPQIKGLIENNKRFSCEYLRDTYYEKIPTPIVRSILFNDELTDDAKQNALFIRTLLALHQSEKLIHTLANIEIATTKELLNGLTCSVSTLLATINQHPHLTKFIFAIDRKKEHFNHEKIHFIKTLLERFELSFVDPIARPLAEPGRLESTITSNYNLPHPPQTGIKKQKIKPLSNTQKKQLLSTPTSAKEASKAKLDNELKLLYFTDLSTNMESRRNPLMNNAKLMYFQTEETFKPERKKIMDSLTMFFHENTLFLKMMEPSIHNMKNLYETLPLELTIFTPDQINPSGFITAPFIYFFPNSKPKKITFHLKHLPSYKILFKGFDQMNALLFSNTLNMTKNIATNRSMFNAVQKCAMDEKKYSQLLESIYQVMEKTLNKKFTDLITGKNISEHDLILHIKYLNQLMLTLSSVLDHRMQDLFKEPDSRHWINTLGYHLSALTSYFHHRKTAETAYLESIRGLVAILQQPSWRKLIISGKEPEQWQNASSQQLYHLSRINHMAQYLISSALDFCFSEEQHFAYFRSIVDVLADTPLFTPVTLSAENDYREYLCKLLTRFARQLILSIIESDDDQASLEYPSLRAPLINVAKDEWLVNLVLIASQLSGQYFHKKAHKECLAWLTDLPAQKNPQPPNTNAPYLAPFLSTINELKRVIISRSSKKRFEITVSIELSKLDTVIKQKEEISTKKAKLSIQSERIERSRTTINTEKHTPPRHTDSSTTELTKTTACATSKNQDICEKNKLTICKKIPKLYDTINFTIPFSQLKTTLINQVNMNSLSPSFKLWIYIEMAERGCKHHLKMIKATALKQEQAGKLYKQLVSAISNCPRVVQSANEEDIDTLDMPEYDDRPFHTHPVSSTIIKSRRDATCWLKSQFPNNELMPDHLAIFTEAPALELESIKRARIILENLLSFFLEATLEGRNFLEMVKQPDFSLQESGQSSLSIHETRCHLLFSKELMDILKELQTTLTEPALHLELSTKKKDLFKLLRLYGADSFRGKPSDSQPTTPHNISIEDRERFQRFNNENAFNLEINPDELKSAFSELDTQLLRIINAN